jgi:peptidoglycan/xylan/chitin deacetylase (PgdA/CDA1 family)
VLASLNWPATVFLVSTLIGKRDIWCEADNPSGATYPLMDAPQIQELRGRGFTFQSHTRSHADLPKTDDAALRNELAGSRNELQDLLGVQVDYLAYPFGRYDDRVLLAAQEAGYRAAFSTQPGFNRLGIERYRLRRLDVFGTDSASALLRKIQLGSNDGSVGNGVRYFTNRLRARLGLRTR